MSIRLPSATQRLFAHYDNPEELAETAPALVMARLMEEGDSQDLRWLTTTFPESRARQWLHRQGHRQLSRRSRWFWQLVLRCPAAPTPCFSDEVWPL